METTFSMVSSKPAHWFRPERSSSVLIPPFRLRGPNFWMMSLRQAATVEMEQFANISVDSTSVFEVGKTGAAASGALTVESGAVLLGGGSIQATVVDNA